MTIYAFIKVIHILAAIIALGFNLSYGVWVARSAREPEHLAYSLRGIKFMDDWLANPSYVLSLLTGLLMSQLAGIPIIETKWVLWSLVLFGVMAIVAFGFYTPTLSKQIKVLEVKGSDNEEYKRLNVRQTALGLTLFSFALVILFLMVVKPV